LTPVVPQLARDHRAAHLLEIMLGHYAMQTLLVLYMAKELLLPGHVENVVGIETSARCSAGLTGSRSRPPSSAPMPLCVYLTPIFGGLIADRFLGRTPAVTLGAVLMAIGHFLMAFEQASCSPSSSSSSASASSKAISPARWAGSTSPADLRRADAFQIFYIAINAGA
jgi:POT family proton-dependent oligopeptide transporter